MKNYIAFNAKYYQKDRVKKIHLHNTRESAIDYLIQPLMPNITDTNLIEEFEKKYAQMKQIAKQRKSYVKEYGNHIIEAVVAISEDMALKIIQEDGNADRLYQGFQQVAEDIKAIYGLEPLQVSLHLDEGHQKQIDSSKINSEAYSHNIHCHITFLNYDFKKERSILRTLKKSDWQNMQDISANAFHKHKMDFQRGKTKTAKGRDHLERNEFVAQQQLKQILELQSEIDNSIDSKREIINDLKEKRQALSKIEMDVTAKKTEYASITSDQKVIREEVNALRAKKKELADYKSTLLSDIDSKAKQIVYANNPNRDTVFQKIVEELKSLSGLNIQLKELKSLEVTNSRLTNQSDTLAIQNARLSSQVKLLQSDKEELKDKNEALAENNKEFQADIQALSKEYKFDYKSWKSSRESQYSKFSKSRTNLSKT
jgi:hypothetical protein